jgi:phospholipase/carboxylesterase
VSATVPNGELPLVHLSRPPQIASVGKPPLLIQLHGVGSNERDLFGFADLLDPRLQVVSVRAPLVRGPDAFAWFDVQRLPTGFLIDPEQLRASRDRLLGFIPAAVAAYGSDSERVYLQGFSQGAIMSLTTVLSQPQPIAGIAAMSGRLPAEARPWIAPHHQLAGVPIFMAHGTFDDVIKVSYAHDAIEVLRTLPVDLTYREYPMPHTIGPEALRDMLAWLTARLDSPRRNEQTRAN